MDGVDPDLIFNITCLQKPPLRPPSLDLVLVGGALKLWVPLFSPHGPFMVMALCHFSATQRWFWSSAPRWIKQETLAGLYPLRPSMQHFFTGLLLPRAVPVYKAQTFCSWILLCPWYSPPLWASSWPEWRKGCKAGFSQTHPCLCSLVSSSNAVHLNFRKYHSGQGREALHLSPNLLSNLYNLVYGAKLGRVIFALTI